MYIYFSKYSINWTKKKEELRFFFSSLNINGNQKEESEGFFFLVTIYILSRENKFSRDRI